MMTVEKILRCEIPKGPHKLAMEHIWNELSESNAISEFGAYQESLCAAFSALYELAQKETREITKVKT